MTARWLGVSLVLTLLVTGCGDSGGLGDIPDDVGTDFGDVTVAGDDEGSGGFGDAGADDEDDGLGDGTLATLPTGVGFSDECAAIFELMQATGSLLIGSDVSLDQVQAAAAALPAEIREDGQVMVQGIAEYVAALEAAGITYDPEELANLDEEQFEQFLAAGEILSTDEFIAAGDNLTEYMGASCETG